MASHASPLSGRSGESCALFLFGYRHSEDEDNRGEVLIAGPANFVRVASKRLCEAVWLLASTPALFTSSARRMVGAVDKWSVAVFSDAAGGTMAEVGLLPFARVALQVPTQVLPAYRKRFPKHQPREPQLLAVLLMMLYEDWTFRKAATRRLREHQEMRAALYFTAVPYCATLQRFFAAAARRHQRSRLA